LTGFFIKNSLDQGELDEALERIDDIAERCRTQGYGLAALYTTCAQIFSILFEMSRYAEVGSEGEELIKEWEKLLPSGATTKTAQDEASFSVGGKNEEAISANDQDEGSISMELLTEKKIGRHKCGEFVLDIVRVAVRHRPGSLLHDRMSEQARLRTLTRLAF